MRDLIEQVVLQIDQEIEEVQQAKIMMSGEQKIREEIRRRLREAMEKKAKIADDEKGFKLRGTEADKRLEMEVKPS